MKTDLTERATTWGTMPVGTSRIQVRHLVVIAGIALWLLPTLITTGVAAIAWIAFNLAFLVILMVVCFPVRAIPLHKLAICFFAGGMFMGLDLAVVLPLVSSIGENSPIRPFITVPMEELVKLLPLFILLWRGRNFSTWTLGATDILLMGAAAGAGFAIVEDSFVHAAHKSLNNLSVLIPAAELVNGRIISGHAIWAGLSAGTIGLAFTFRHIKKLALVIAPLGFIVAVVDHLALNYSQFAGAFPWGKTLFDTLAANGYLALVFFLSVLLACIGVDLFVIWRSLPKAKEFGLPARKTQKDQKDRKEPLESLWDCIMDLRRLNYAHYRYDRCPSGELPAELALTVAILAKRLVNRYLAVEPVNITVKGSVNQGGVKINLPDSESAITVMPERLSDTEKTHLTELGIRVAAHSTREGHIPVINPNDSSPTSGRSAMAIGISPFDPRPIHEQIDLPDRYEIIQQVGEGGMGLIFAARHKNTGAKLAIKVLHPHLAKNTAYLKRFEQEAKAASTLNHPGIVTVHDFGITNRQIAYLVMEWLEGPSLDNIIKQQGPQLTPRVFDMFLQTTDALAHAHRKGIIHRDIKPSNIIITRSDRNLDQVKIVDFGIAKVVGEDTEQMNLTATGDVLGSPLFMSPEQCMGGKIDLRSDIYSLGCVMYEALCGVPPFRGDNSVQVIFKHMNEMPPRPTMVNPNILKPQAIEQALFRCLQKKPEARFATMEELQQELLKQAEIHAIFAQ